MNVCCVWCRHLCTTSIISSVESETKVFLVHVYYICNVKILHFYNVFAFCMVSLFLSQILLYYFFNTCNGFCKSAILLVFTVNNIVPIRHWKCESDPSISDPWKSDVVIARFTFLRLFTRQGYAVRLAIKLLIPSATVTMEVLGSKNAQTEKPASSASIAARAKATGQGRQKQNSRSWLKIMPR